MLDQAAPLAGMPKNAALVAVLAELKRRQDRKKLERYKPYQKQIDFHNDSAQYRERLFMAGNQLGKEQPNDEPVLTPHGWVPMGSLKVGDQVIAGNGKPCTVTGVFPQGVKPVYKLTFCDGASTRCGWDHLWKVKLGKRERFGKGRHADNWRVLPLSDIVAHGGYDPAPLKRAAIPVPGAIEFDAQAVPIDPYLLGALLGDGGMSGKMVSFTSADQQILDEVSKRLPGGVRLIGSKRNAIDFRISGRVGQRNPLVSALRSLRLMGHGSATKFVPSIYKMNTPDVRLEVLRGLMDTDGCVSTDGAIEFATISTRLAEDVEFLARSLGGKVKRSIRQTHYTYKGEKRAGKPSWRLRIRLPHIVPFRLTRKAERCFTPVSTCDHRVLYRIEPAGEAECTCIAVDSDDHTYVTKDFIVTHNTWSSAYEIAYHLTGQYPDWWQGKRWNRGVTGWALGESMESTRDTLQRLVLGRPGEWGTGSIPADCIIGEPKRAQGVPDCVDMVMVRHVSGQISRLYFKSYEKGRSKLQGETLDFAALDEEPPLDIYTEVLTRTNATRGLVWITFTPLLGMSLVVQRFMLEENPDRHITKMTIYDVDHYTPEDRERIVASYPAHEREARAKGIPVLGDGAVYPVAESEITVEPFALPDSWPRICGIDFGWDHPTATVWLAYDEDNDITYVYDIQKYRKQTPKQIAPFIKARGEWVPIAWPHDGLQTEKGSGVQIAERYRDEDLYMLHERAQYPETGDEDGAKVSRSSVAAGILDILTAMQTGKFKVFSNLSEWFEEFRMYHRKNGKIVKLQDDAMDATRYARMMLRYASVPPAPRQIARAKREYDWRAG